MDIITGVVILLGIGLVVTLYFEQKGKKWQEHLYII